MGRLEQADLWEARSDTPRIGVISSFDTPSYEVVTEPSQLEALLPRLLESPILGVDCETTGLDPLADRLRLVQIASSNLTIVVDLQTCPAQALAPLFSNAREMVFHNAGFDLQFLTAANLPWSGRIFDSMLMAQILGAGGPDGNLSRCGLGTVVDRFLGLFLPKDKQKSLWDGPLSQEQIEYAARDAAVLLPLAEQLKQDLRTAGLERVADIENRCIPALAWVELTGLPINTDQWLACAQRNEERVSTLEAQLHALVGQDTTQLQLLDIPIVNWRSPKQILQVLQDRGHRISSTGSATLATLNDSLAQTLLEYRDVDTRAHTFGREWLEKHRSSITDRIHASYLQCGSAAGRMSCIKPNVQNIPKSSEYRRCVQGEEGWTLIKADFSQIELRIAAVIANDEAMLAAFRKGQDLHSVTAANVLRIPLTQVEKLHRQLAKSLNFGLVYGMGARGLRIYAANNYKVTLTQEEAEKHKQTFFQTYRGLSNWHRKTAAQLEQEKHIDTCTLAGRRRLGVVRYTECLNTPVQGTGADGLKLAMARLFEHRREAPNARLIAVVHDEVVAECASEQAEQTADWLKRHMTMAMTEIIGDAVPVEVEVTIGRDWAGTPVRE